MTTALILPSKISYTKSVPELTPFIMATGISKTEKFGATKHNHFSGKLNRTDTRLATVVTYTISIIVLHFITLKFRSVKVISLNKLTVHIGRWFAPNDLYNALWNDYNVHCALWFVFSFSFSSHVTYLYEGLLSLESNDREKLIY